MVYDTLSATERQFLIVRFYVRHSGDERSETRPRGSAGRGGEDNDEEEDEEDEDEERAEDEDEDEGPRNGNSDEDDEDLHDEEVLERVGFANF